MPVAYIKLKRGGYQKVPEYDDYVYENPTINLGTYRNTGWIPNQLPTTDIFTVGATATMLVAQVTPATGNTATPDEMAHIAPRVIVYNETKLRFTSGGRTVAEFFLANIVSWSNSPPQAAA